MLQLTNGSETAQFIFTAAPAIVTWEDYCKNITDLSLNITVKLYARNNGLLSYQAQQRTFLWKIPTLIDIVPDTATAVGKMTDWGGGDRIVVPAGPKAGEATIMYENMPIFLIQHDSASEASYLPAIANETYRWHDEQDLVDTVDNLRWNIQR